MVGTLSNMSEREDHRLGQDLEVELPRSCPNCVKTRIVIHLGDIGIEAEHDNFERHATHFRAYVCARWQGRVPWSLPSWPFASSFALSSRKLTERAFPWMTAR